MRLLSWENVANRWASWGEAAIRSKGGAAMRVLFEPARGGDWEVVAELGASCAVVGFI
jgi:hypothetical protein